MNGYGIRRAMYLLGLDIGSSSVKAALVDARNGQTVAAAQSPEREMEIAAPRPGWAEQDPNLWWRHVCQAVQLTLQRYPAAARSVDAIGIAYQMHGLVAVGADGQPLRPAVIWCDSRAVAAGEAAQAALGEQFCLQHYLNMPGNFTASKIKWMRDHEPDLFEKIRHVFLPGDYIAYRMTGTAGTTIGGLSEGILWDFAEHRPADRLLEFIGLDPTCVPPILPTFGQQGRLTAAAAAEMGLPAGIPVTYRAGDQPNNALSLGVLQPGEAAATGGTSGVVYGVLDRPAGDPQNRVNCFAHVNHSSEAPRIGVLLCINGAGIQYSWVRRHFADENASYFDLERAAAEAPVGSDGLRILPFGNGAERMLQHRNTGAQMLRLDFNRHQAPHVFRAALEGIAFSFAYGMEIMKQMGINLSVMRVGNDNLFQSSIFSNTLSQLMDCRIEVLRSSGASGAAIAAGVGAGWYDRPEEGLKNLEREAVFEPEKGKSEPYREAYLDWSEWLHRN